jgi:hypothetical protein
VKAAPSIGVTEQGAAHEQAVFVEASWIECRALLRNL